MPPLRDECGGRTASERGTLMSVRRLGVGPRLSAAGVPGNPVYVAGQVSGDAADVKGQTAEILKKIDALLAQAGSHKGKLLSATVYLADMKTYDQMNAAWEAWVDAQNTPARATVETKLASPKYLVEIAAIAAI